MKDEKILTEKEEKYCELRSKGLNRAQCYIGAGYTSKNPSSDASKMEQKPHIVQRILECKKERVEELGVDESFIVGNMKDAITALRKESFNNAISARDRINAASKLLEGLKDVYKYFIQDKITDENVKDQELKELADADLDEMMLKFVNIGVVKKQ